MSANPSQLDFADWFSVVSAAIVSGILSAMGWFAASKRKLVERIGKTEELMKELSEKHANHATQLAVLQQCQKTTEERLEAINETTRDTNQDLKKLNETLTQVLLKMQKDD